MTEPLLSDEVWARIEPLFPIGSPWIGMHARLPDRVVLTGILFVLKTGIPWEDLTAEMGYGTGMTCRGRLQEWNEVGIWERLHPVLSQELRYAGEFDWARAAIDGTPLTPKAGASTPADLRSAQVERARELHLRAEEMHRLRVIEGWSLHEIADIFGVSSERVRQILENRFGVTGVPPAAQARRVIRRETKRAAQRRRPIAEAFGALRGQIEMADDFNELPADFAKHLR
jgi:transposase